MNNNQSELIQLKNHLQGVVIGQENLIDRLLISLLTGGHILLEGAPGLAKTTAVKALASCIHASFQRIQFTPDLLPADLTGAEIFNPETRQFEYIQGPVFNEIVLADEINRAPPKIQSALLEAMQEHQVTVGGKTRHLPGLFLVMATQNPLEQSGTYPLPEAQLDRFLLHVKIDYPSAESELAILKQDKRNFQQHPEDNAIDIIESKIKPADLLEERKKVANTYIDEELEKYIVNLVTATREIANVNSAYTEMLDYGASPRASIALYKAASAMAYLRQRDYVIPEDIHHVIHDVFRHRIILNYNASISEITVDNIVDDILNTVQVP